MPKSLPRIAILMASYNGEEWIAEQIQSILRCSNVVTHIFLSDDGSTDNTVAIARDVGGSDITILPTKRQGSAGANFYRLILDTPWDDFDFVALADQDDIWVPTKLARAVTSIQSGGYAAYSSDVIAFWPDNRTLYIRKSQPQRKWDHLFEGGGPGNTFVWPRVEADFLRERLLASDPDVLAATAPHDWLFYAIFREAGKSWLIDEYSGLNYRQHGANVMGAATGPAVILKRVKMLRNQWYRSQVLNIAHITSAENPVLNFVRAPTLINVWNALAISRHCRRKRRDTVALMIFFFLMAVRHKSKE
ncbi:glycosyltransferase [Sulfitobacter sp. CW3]|uniref:glycosyltransferase n=1 Tax=Sulfitobacter sp. CW3 TaxID=2861965 RepID=UPI001C5ECE8B|nr:glycosyltransferase [Sulfitobacter sp. CW3]MBW4964147.1 glycosyltransferase [Sulfitobacter sp. CW3]